MPINDYSDLEIEVEISQTPVTVDFSVDQAEVDLTEEEIAILRGPAEDLSLFVKKEQTIAGVDLQDNITKNELLTALNVQDGAEANAVDSVNGKTGAVVLTASDVGALPDDTVIPTVNNGTLTIQKNGSTVATFSANQSTNQTVNITVPTQASDVNALPDTTKYGASIDLSIDSSTFVVTAQLKDQDGNNIGSAKTIDLPSENAIVDASLSPDGKTITFILQSGNTFDVDVSAIVSGLVADTRTIAGLRLNQNISAGDLRTALNVEDGAEKNTVTSVNSKTGAVVLNADDIGDSTTINKFVTEDEKFIVKEYPSLSDFPSTTYTYSYSTEIYFNYTSPEYYTYSDGKWTTNVPILNMWIQPPPNYPYTQQDYANVTCTITGQLPTNLYPDIATDSISLTLGYLEIASNYINVDYYPSLTTSYGTSEYNPYDLGLNVAVDINFPQKVNPEIIQGALYKALDTGKLYILDNGAWAEFTGNTMSLVPVIGYVDKKQDKLIDGQNIMTINGSSILQSGNLNLVTSSQINSYLLKSYVRNSRSTSTSGYTYDVRYINGLIKTTRTTTANSTYDCTYVNGLIKTSDTSSNNYTYSCTYVNNLIKTSTTVSDTNSYSCTYMNNTFLTLETLPKWDGGNE